MKHLPARVFGLVMLLALGFFLIGFFAGSKWLTISGGIVVVLYDVIGIWLGLLKPLVPIVFAVIGALALSALGYPWYYGVFWASAVFGLFDVRAHLTRAFRPDISKRISDRALFESGLFEMSEQSSVDPEAEAEAEECWAEFETRLSQAFVALSKSQEVGLENRSPATQNTNETRERQSEAFEELVAQANRNLDLADDCLQQLQTVWIEHEHSVRQLRRAVAEYQTMVRVGWDTREDLLSVRATRRGRRHADRGDELLSDALSRLGLSVEIRVGDRTRRYP